MMRMNSRLKWAGVCIACTFCGFALKVAWATAAAGLSTIIVAGPSRLEAIDVRTESDINEVEIKLKGSSDVYVVHNTIVPGGHTGWHSHPGPSIISVKSGTATEYNSDEPNTPHIHEAGTSFVDSGEHAHKMVNEGTTNLELVAFQILPRGAMRRIDAPQP